MSTYTQFFFISHPLPCYEVVTMYTLNLLICTFAIFKIKNKRTDLEIQQQSLLCTSLSASGAFFSVSMAFCFCFHLFVLYNAIITHFFLRWHWWSVRIVLTVCFLNILVNSVLCWICTSLTIISYNVMVPRSLSVPLCQLFVVFITKFTLAILFMTFSNIWKRDYLEYKANLFQMPWF